MPQNLFPSFMHDTIGMLNSYDPFVIKLAVIVLSIIVIYFIRKVLFNYLENGLLKIARVRDYTKQILSKIRKPAEILTIIINFDIIIFVYNDYNSIDVMREIFTIVYIVMLTYMVYLLQNSIISIKLENIDAKNKIKSEVINISLKIFNFIIILIGLLIALHFAGVNLTAILSGLGIGGLAVALAAKETLSNFFGTLSILASDTFSQGDWIVSSSVEGTVVEIGLRVTTIRTFDNALISVPNATLANSDVKNWSKRSVGRRIKMNIGVKYDSKREDIQNAIKEIRSMLENHPNIATEKLEYELENKKRYLVSEDDVYGVKKTLLVYLDEFASSSINILVYCFSTTVVWAEWLEVKEDVMLKIMGILERNNLEFAFPSLSIYEEKS
ncbi:MAG: mechanosensitive ion channel family protein [Helicobacteraceae bacterium]|nr:mechanosensitive ion channel family protein [Helicobacteraceae bacterium]